MLLCENFAIKIVFSIFFLSLTGNDNKSMNSEHGFASSFATNNSIVSDVIQGQSKLQNSITDSFAESCPFYFNTSKQCFPTLKKNNSSFELYNLTEEAKKLNLSAERENLRLFAETSSENSQSGFGLKAQAFFKDSINYIFGLTESQKFFIAVSYFLALWKLHGAKLRSIISNFICKLFGKTKKAIHRKISTNPSEKSIHVQNDIARDEHVNTDDLTTDSCESHVTADEETIDSCDSHVVDDKESANLPCEEHVDTDYDVTTSDSVDDLPSASPNNQNISPANIPPQLKHSFSFNSSDSLFEESCDENFPDEFFVFPSDCGNIGLILADEDWEKIECDSSQESLISDDGGAASTSRESRQSYDVGCDVDSRNSHSSCHRHVPKEVVSCLSYSYVGDSAVTNGSDNQIEENHGSINYCNHGNIHQWILGCGDSNNYSSPTSCTSNIDYSDESTNSSLYDSDQTSESLYEDSLELYPGEYAEHGISLQRSESESDIGIELYNKIELENLPAGDINKWLSVDIENEIIQEDTTETTLEQRVKNHVVATAIFTGTFVLPCFIAARLLK